MTLPESWRTVGNKIRQLRKTNRLTLKQLSRGCDLSANTISLVERGEVAPTIETLCKIANALGVSPGSLFLEACTPQVILQRAIETGHDTEVAEVALQTLACASSSCSSGRSSILCLCGQFDFEVDGQSYSLKPGDNLTFNSNAFHRLRNPGVMTGTAVLVLHPNTLIGG